MMFRRAPAPTLGAALVLVRRWLSRSSEPSVAPARGGWIGGVGLQQADADLPAVFVDALDHVSVELELADDYGGEVNPAGAQLVERHWLVARAPCSLEHPQLLGFGDRHRQDPSPHILPGASRTYVSASAQARLARRLGFTTHIFLFSSQIAKISVEQKCPNAQVVG